MPLLVLGFLLALPPALGFAVSVFLVLLLLLLLLLEAILLILRLEDAVGLATAALEGVGWSLSSSASLTFFAAAFRGDSDSFFSSSSSSESSAMTRRFLVLVDVFLSFLDGAGFLLLVVVVVWFVDEDGVHHVVGDPDGAAE